MIEGLGRGQLPQQVAPRLVAGGGEVTPRAPAVFEPAAKAAGGIVREMAASAPVDSARVETLRLAIASGSYKPDPGAIAARMMAFGRK